MNKLLVIFFIVVIVGIAVFVIVSPKDEITKEEQEFNDSGQAKAILDETDLWMFYDGDDFGIKYPHDVTFNPNRGAGLYIMTHDTTLDQPSPLPKFEVKGTEKVFNIDGIEVETFMTLGRFEVCDVQLERELNFMRGDESVIVMLRGDVDVLKSEHPEFFRTDQGNCGNQLMWDYDKQLGFFNLLKNGNGGTETQAWFDTFDAIIGTLEFYQDSVSIEGKWESTDDQKSVIEFRGSNKIDYYDDEIMSQEVYEIIDTNLKVGEDMEYTIIELTEDTLVLTYLARGNTLTYKKIK